MHTGSTGGYPGEYIHKSLPSVRNLVLIAPIPPINLILVACHPGGGMACYAPGISSTANRGRFSLANAPKHDDNIVKQNKERQNNWASMTIAAYQCSQF
jgi:hypothetical protein